MMNNKQVRVIDPILSNIARGYMNAEFTGNLLFPRVPVSVSGGQILEFGREAFLKYNLRRAPGADVVEVSFGYLGKPFALVQDALAGKVPTEHMRDANVTPGIDLGTGAINDCMRIITLALETEQAALARNAANYGADNKIDLSGASWFNPDSDPAADVRLGKEAIGDGIGMEPNVLHLSPRAFAALTEHPKILRRFESSERAIINTAMLASLFDVEQVAVGRARFLNSLTDTKFTPVWGEDAILAFTQLGSPQRGAPSYGYTYAMDGHPMAEPAYYKQANKSWMYPVTYERAPVIAGAAAGYLFQGAGAPFTG